MLPKYFLTRSLFVECGNPFLSTQYTRGIRRRRWNRTITIAYLSVTSMNHSLAMPTFTNHRESWWRGIWPSTIQQPLAKDSYCIASTWIEKGWAMLSDPALPPDRIDSTRQIMAKLVMMKALLSDSWVWIELHVCRSFFSLY